MILDNNLIDQALKFSEDFMPFEQEQEALERQNILEYVETICEIILTNSEPVDLEFKDYKKFFIILLDMLNYYKDMFALFSKDSVRTDLLDYEFILNVLMVDGYDFENDKYTVQTMINILLKNTYNRVYSAAVMLIGAGNIKFPDKKSQIAKLYKQLSHKTNFEDNAGDNANGTK